MIISLTLNGELYNIEPEQIYQGSNNVNEIFIIAPLSANTSFTMTFELPNGYITQPYVLERIAPVSNTLNTWKLVVDTPLTQYYGNVKFQFKGQINGTTTASGQGTFRIIEGVDWVLPAVPDTNTYELIVNKIAQIEGAVINVKDNSEEALSKSKDALEKSEQALTEIQEAIDKGNEAYNLASSVEAKASEALQKADNANTNASTALQTAEEAKTIASEKANSKVFDTYGDMVAWLRDANNKGKISVGTTLYIKAEDVPDYWITAVLEESDPLGFYYEFEELESKLPDITNMVTTDTEQNIVGAKNFTSIKKNGYDLQGKLTSIDFASIDGMTTYADGKATIHGEFTTTTETDQQQNTFDGSIEFGIKGSDTIVVEEDETGSCLEIHLDQSVEQRFENIENDLGGKVGQSSINNLQQQIDQTNIDVNEIRNTATNNTTRIEELGTVKADAIDLANLNAKALKTPVQAPSKLQVVAIDTNNAQTLVDLPEGSILYDTTGQNTNGAMSQQASTNIFATKTELPTKTSELENDSGFIQDNVMYCSATNTSLFSYTTPQWTYQILPLSTLTKYDPNGKMSVAGNHLDINTTKPIIISAEVQFTVNKSCVMYMVVESGSTTLKNFNISCSSGSHKMSFDDLVVDVKNPNLTISFSCNTANVTNQVNYVQLNVIGVE